MFLIDAIVRRVALVLWKTFSSFWLFLDEQLVLKTLPKYVVDSPDSMPSARLFEGDFQSLTKFFEKLNARMEECGSSVGAILKELLSLKDQVQALSTARPSSCDWPPLPSRSDRPALQSQQSRGQPSAAINNQSASLLRDIRLVSIQCWVCFRVGFKF